MADTYPSGYGGSNVTLDQVRQRHRSRYHPEAWRRIEAIMVASRGLLGLNPDQGLCGIGGGARTREEQASAYARDPNTFAPPDRSFHQVWTWRSGMTGAQAVDWVGRAGRHQEAWKFLRDHGGLYGLKTFWNINGEPWHSQCVDVPNSVSEWLKLGKPDPQVWALPGQAPAPPPPTGDYGLWPFNRNKPEIMLGSLGDAVRYLQRVLGEKANQRVTVDGEFGPQTESGLKNLQAFLMGPGRDSGRCDLLTWEMIDAVAGFPPTPTAPPPPPDGGTPPPPPKDYAEVATGLYYVQRGDSPWKAAERCYGNGAMWQGNFTNEQFAQPDVQVPVPNLPGRTTVVRSGDGPFALIGRMWPTANRYASTTLQRFYDLNGGQHRTLRTGETVYLDQPKS